MIYHSFRLVLSLTYPLDITEVLVKLAVVNCNWSLLIRYVFVSFYMIWISLALIAIKSDTHDCNERLGLSSLAFFILIDQSPLNSQIKFFLDLAPRHMSINVHFV